MQRLIETLHTIREAGGLTRERVESLHHEAKLITGGAVDDSAQFQQEIRDLRRMLFTLAFDAGHWPLAEELLELACPPDLRVPPVNPPMPTTTDEHIKWRSNKAMLLDALGDYERAREAFMLLGEDYLALKSPDESRFALLTNAVQSAYELGDYAIGESLLLRAELLAEGWSSESVKLNLALARLYPPLPECDLKEFRKRHASVSEIAAQIAPTLIGRLNHFAVLSSLQMGRPDAAEGWLGPMPPDDATEMELLVDTLVRLQVEVGLGRIDRLLVDRGFALLGHSVSSSQEASLIGVLAIASFKLGQVGSAVLLATLFLRQIDQVASTLPCNPQTARQRRNNILSALKPLQAALVMAGYIHAAEEVASIDAILTHGGVLPFGSYSNWSPGPTAAKAIAALSETISAARNGERSPDEIKKETEAFEFCPAPFAPTRHNPGCLSLSFLPRNGRLALFIHEGNDLRQLSIDADADELALLIQNLHRSMRLGVGGERERERLGKVMFKAVESEIANAKELNISAFGPVAGLPFNCLDFHSRPLIQDRQIIVRSCVSAAPRKSQTAESKLKILYASGGSDDNLKHVGKEARAITEIYGSECNAVVSEFDKAALETVLEHPPEILHIASHFYVSEYGSGTTYVSGAKAVPISLTDVFTPNTDLSATKLVFLSGCDSASHAGAQSLASQLNALGAHNVIASLWPVDDGATAELARLTHEDIAAGLKPAAALAEAVQTLRNFPHFSHPRYWAAFQCYQA